ncbi:MAG: hypothetical protein FRX49_11566 [Trebouxia sp. A1-2]|nr:MAG: hypothetical protein FRX49_11566 [Trebouxia sp. A1-2]
MAAPAVEAARPLLPRLSNPSRDLRFGGVVDLASTLVSLAVLPSTESGASLVRRRRDIRDLRCGLIGADVEVAAVPSGSTTGLGTEASEAVTKAVAAAAASYCSSALAASGITAVAQSAVSNTVNRLP